jgi:hypothetical protein
MLYPQVIVNLFPQICVCMDLVKHDQSSVCVYLTDAISLANRMIGQVAMNTIIPKATSSDKKPGCALYAWRSLKKREARKSIELVVSMFMSIIDNR